MADPAAGKAMERASRLYRGQRSGMIAFYKDLARMGRGKISARMLADDRKSKDLEDARRLLEGKLAEFVKDSASSGKDYLAASLLRLSMAMFLLERTAMLHPMVLKKNSLSMYSFFASTRSQVCALLGPSYYQMTTDAAVSSLMDVEPMLAACTELCGLEMPDMREAVLFYQSRVLDRLKARRK